MRLLPIIAVLAFCVTSHAGLAQGGAIDPLSIPPGTLARIIGPANARDVCQTHRHRRQPGHSAIPAQWRGRFKSSFLAERQPNGCQRW